MLMLRSIGNPRAAEITRAAIGRHVGDGLDLGPVFLDAPVAGDDEPFLAGGLGEPDRVERGGVGDGARRPYTTALDWSARVAGVGNVASELDEDLRDAEQVGIDVVMDAGRSRPAGHAARAGVS
jgi:hypothetical protein